MASTPTRLMTFAEFEQLPTPQDGRLELRHGEVVKVPPPKYGHSLIQDTLRELLTNAAAGAGRAFVEFGFRPKSDREYRIADVAYALRERLARQNPQGYFEGAPELVIEIISPANTMAEMLDKRILCLENGALEFWLVDPAHRHVEVSTPDGHAIAYKTGQEIPLFFGGHIAVDAIFSEGA